MIRAFHPGHRDDDILNAWDPSQRVLEATGTWSNGQDGLDSFLANQPTLAPIVASLNSWRARLYHFRALRTGTQRTQQTTSPETLDPTGSNLAGVLHYLLTDRTELFEQVGALIAQLVPGIGILRVRTSGGHPDNHPVTVVWGSFSRRALRCRRGCRRWARGDGRRFGS